MLRIIFDGSLFKIYLKVINDAVCKGFQRNGLQSPIYETDGITFPEWKLFGDRAGSFLNTKYLNYYLCLNTIFLFASSY